MYVGFLNKEFLILEVVAKGIQTSLDGWRNMRLI